MPSYLLALALSLISATALAGGRLDAVLAQAMKGSAVPAMAVLELKGGTVTGEAVRGLRRNDAKNKAQIGDVWATGSDGKPITAAMIARLVDRGLLNWDTPLAQWLPDEVETMRPEYRAVTLLQLLTHHSGLPADTADLAFFASFFADQRPLPEQRKAYAHRILTEAPAVAPGSAAHYSNNGFLVAAVVAERVTGKAFETLMAEEVFQPLGMSTAKYVPTGAGQISGHRRGKPIATTFVSADDGNPLMLAPVGAELHLSLRDWARFCQDQLAGAKGQGKLLSAESYRRMQSVQFTGTSGVGWGVQASIAKRKGPVLLHAGSDGNWYALVALFPESGNGALVAANAGEDMGGDKATMAALGAMLPKLSPALAK